MNVSSCHLRLSISAGGTKTTSADATSTHATYTAATAAAAAAATTATTTASPGTTTNTTATAADDDDAYDAAGSQNGQASCTTRSSPTKRASESRCSTNANAAKQ